MTEIGQKLIGLVRAKAAENPEFVYVRPRSEAGIHGSCKYVVDGQPSCLIGHALWGAGLIDSSFEENYCNTYPFRALVHELGLQQLDDNERKWLISVQHHQDDGRSWGTAVEWTDNGGP